MSQPKLNVHTFDIADLDKRPPIFVAIDWTKKYPDNCTHYGGVPPKGRIVGVTGKSVLLRSMMDAYK